jgi:hypothetical protein
MRNTVEWVFGWEHGPFVTEFGNRTYTGTLADRAHSIAIEQAIGFLSAGPMSVGCLRCEPR